MRKVLSAAILSLVAGNTAACTLGPMEEGWVDPAIRVLADGSFSGASDHYYTRYYGGSFEDLGNFKTMQMIGEGVCPPFLNRLLLTDCESLEMIEVYGTLHDWSTPFEEPVTPYTLYPNSTNFDITAIPRLLELLGPPPTTPVELSTSDGTELIGTIAEFAERVAELNYDVEQDVLVNLSEMSLHNRYDPFNGCKIHYPNSAGASK